MSNPLEVLEAEVLSLPAADRARLLDKLIISLDADAEMEAEWDAVADAREEELKAGTAKALPADEVIAELRAMLSE
jgi:putative addiction module component (TIGR02574 family)